MRKSMLRNPCAAALLSAVVAGQASAAFIISTSRYADGPDDVVVFRALNDGTGNQAGTTKLGSANITLTAIGHSFIFNFQDIDGDNVNDANVVGSGPGFAFPIDTTPQANLPIGSFIRIGNTASNFTVPSNGGTSPQAFSDPDKSGIPDGPNPTANYTNIEQFTVQGTILGGGVAASSTPSAFAVALVPAGTAVDLTGSLAAEAGSPSTVTGQNVVPEPSGGLVVGALSFIALHRRRRRACPGIDNP